MVNGKYPNGKCLLMMLSGTFDGINVKEFAQQLINQ